MDTNPNTVRSDSQSGYYRADVVVDGGCWFFFLVCASYCIYKDSL